MIDKYSLNINTITQREKRRMKINSDHTTLGINNSKIINLHNVYQEPTSLAHMFAFKSSFDLIVIHPFGDSNCNFEQ